jgi:hypothetical protein
MEVEIDHGRVISKGCEVLPDKASGLLTILKPAQVPVEQISPLEALEALQKHLRLDEAGASKWMESVQNARR